MSAGLLASKLLVEPKDIVEAQVVSLQGGGGGGYNDPIVPSEWLPEPGRSPFPVFVHQLSSQEKTRAGILRVTNAYTLWCLLINQESPALGPDVLQVPSLGRVDVNGVLIRQTEGLCALEVVPKS